MRNKPRTLILKILPVFAAVSIVLCGLSLIVAAVEIYRSSESPYSRDAVAQAFGVICPIVYGCILLCITAGVLCPPHAADPRRADSLHTLSARRKALYAQRIQCADEDTAAQIHALHRQYRLFLCGKYTLFGIMATGYLSYALQIEHFPVDEINRSVAKAALLLLLCLIPTAAFQLFAVQRERQLLSQQIELLRRIPGKTEQPCAQSGHLFHIARIAVLCTALALAVYGLCGGGIADVLAKAVNICTECIGLG